MKLSQNDPRWSSVVLVSVSADGSKGVKQPK